MVSFDLKILKPFFAIAVTLFPHGRMTEFHAANNQKYIRNKKNVERKNGIKMKTIFSFQIFVFEMNNRKMRSTLEIYYVHSKKYNIEVGRDV